MPFLPDTYLLLREISAILRFMKKLFCAALFSAATLFADDSIGGFWIIPDSDTGKPESVARFFKKPSGKYCAHMVLIYDEATGKPAETIADPKERAKGIDGNPFICGLEFIWGLELQSDGRYKGKVIDPDSGKTYRCEVWFDKSKNELAVRGELFIFGLTNYWPPISEKNLPAQALAEPTECNAPHADADSASAGNAPEAESKPVAVRKIRPRFFRLK